MATTSTGSIVADVVPESRKGEGMGYFVMSMNLAMVAGPFIAFTIFREWNIVVLFLIGTCFSLVGLLLGLGTTLTREVPPPERQKLAIMEKRAVPISLTSAYFGFAYSTVLSFLAVFAEKRGLEMEASFFFVVYAFVLVLSRPFTGRWFDQYGANRVIYPAIIFFGIGMFCLGMSTTASLFFIAAGFIGVGWGTLFSSFQTVAIQSVDPGKGAH